MLLKKLVTSLVAIMLFFTSIDVTSFANEKELKKSDEKKVEKTPTKAEKVRELRDLRELNTKTYVNSDGTYTKEIFTENVHYEEDGELESISNIPELNQEEENSDYKYINNDNQFDVKFAKDTKRDQLLSIQLKDEIINFKLLKAKNSQVRKDNELIIYENILNGVDIKYSLGSSSVKEDIFLKKKSSTRKFEFFITGSLIPKKEDRNIDFYNEKNELIWTMPHPFMEDQNGKYSEEIEFNVEKYNDGYLLTLVPDEEFLDAKDTKYPVRIDPTVNIGGTSANTLDTYVMQKYPNYNYYTTPELRTGYTTSTGTTRSYINFSQSLPNLSGKLLVKAELKLYKWNNIGDTIATNVYANRVTKAWDSSTIFYSTQPSFDTSVTYGSTSAEGTAKLLNMNLTDLVNGWMKGTFPNYGIVLRSSSEGTAGTYRKYNSSETATNKPYLAITYSEIPAAPTATAYSNSDGTGYVDLSWSKVDGATGYKVLIFNGRTYEEVDVGNVTSWSTKGKKLWPTRSQIDGKQYNLRLKGDGRELPENPNDLYKRGGGNYQSSTNYWFRIKAYNKYSTTSQSPEVTPSIPDKTKPTVPTAVQITNDRIESFTVGWQPSTDLDGSGLAKYKVYVGDQPNVANIINGVETTNQFYTVEKTLEPRKTYYAWVQAIDKSGNISNNSAPINKAARKEFDAQIESFYIPNTSDIDNREGENLWFDVRNTGTANWTNDSNLSLSITSKTPDGTPAVGYKGYLNTGEVIKPNEVKRFYVNWKSKEAVIGSYELTAVVGQGANPIAINPKENYINRKIEVKDLRPPTGNFVINQNAKYTTDRNVKLNVSNVYDNSNGEKFVQFANGPENASISQLIFSPKQLLPQSSASFDWTLEDRDGTHFVYTQFSDKSGNLSQIHHDMIIYDRTKPKISISNVKKNDYIKGIKKIEGSITDDLEKVSYSIEYSKVTNEMPDWKLIKNGTEPINKGVLAEWDTNALPKGEYFIRISATDEAGQTNEETIRVWVDQLEQEWLGYEDYYPIRTLSLLDGNGFVNLYNGSLNINDSDFSIPSRAFSVGLGRSYSSNRSQTGMLGKGWISSLEENLEIQSGIVRYQDSDGTIHQFDKLSDGQFSIPTGTSLYLTFSESKGYSLTTRDGSLVTKVFDTEGRLQKIEDINGNMLKYEYDGAVLKKVSSLNKYFTLKYNSDNTISEVQFSTGEIVKYEHTDGFLTDVKQLTKNGKVSRYVQYNYENGKIKSVVSENGLTVEFMYNGDRIVETKTIQSTRVIDKDKKYPTKTYDSISTFFDYNLENQKIMSNTSSINPNNTRKNLANVEYELNTQGNLAKTKTIRTYSENEDPENAYEDERNLISISEYEQNRIKSVTDPLGNKTIYIYDSYGNVLEQTLPSVTVDEEKKNYSLKYKYNDRGQLTEAINTLGQVKVWKYDSKGNVEEIIDEEGNHQYFQYDSYGNIKKTKSDRGPLYGFIPDYSMEKKDLVNWTVQGTAKKVTSHAKSGKQSIELDANSVIQTEKIKIKSGKLPVSAYINALASTNVTAEFKLQFLKENSVVKESVETQSLTESWKQYNLTGSVPSDATHIRVQVTNKGTASLFLDDLILEETNLETTYVYDNNGENVEQIIDPYGYKTTYTYDVYRQVLTETNELNQTVSIVYDEEQRVKKLTDRMGRTTEFQYDAMGNVIKEINSLGQETNYEYNEWGQLVYTKLPPVTMTSYIDEKVDKTETKQAHLYIEYDELGRKIKETDQKGNILAEEYDGYGRVARSIDPMQNQKYFDYDKNGNVVHTIDYAAKDSLENGEKLLIAKGETFASYDEWNRQLTETDNTGNRNVITMKNTYDSESRLKKTVDSEGTEFNYTFNAAGESVYSIDNSNPSVETWTYYDGLGIPAITLSGNTIEFSVADANGQVIETVDYKGTKTTFSYNQVGDKTKQTNPDGSSVEWTYNKDGQILTETQQVEETEEHIIHLVTKYEYNNAGEVIKQKQEAKVYDKKSKETTTSTLKEVELTYDELGRVVRENSKHYEEESTTPKKSDVRFLYDLNGNLIRKWIYDESSKTLNKLGETVSDFVRSESVYEYDNNNRFTLEEKVENQIKTVKTYKDDENAEGISSPLGTTTVYYNENDLETKVITPKNEQYITTYTAGELKDTIKGPRITVDMDYGKNDKMTSIQTKKKDSTNVLFSETYGYNAEEQITSATNAQEGQKSYSYTAEGFLKTVTKGTETLTYSYDVNGNLLKTVNQSGKILLENQYGIGNRITSSIQYHPDTEKYQKVTYSFSMDGSLQEETYHTLSSTIEEAKNAQVDFIKIYDYASINLLRSITTKKGTEELEKIEFTYDSENNRTSKRVTTSEDNSERFEFYYYDTNGDLVSISEKVGGDQVENLMNIYRDSSGQLFNFEYKGKSYDYLYNQRGDIVAITNELQEIVARYTYDEWGNILNIDASTELGREVAEANPFRYVGKFGVQYDEDTELYFMGWRDYDSKIGRFLVADEYEGEDSNPISFNRYLYAESDPVNNIDPDGYAPKWLKKIAKGVKKASKLTKVSKTFVFETINQ